MRLSFLGLLALAALFAVQPNAAQTKTPWWKCSDGKVLIGDKCVSFSSSTTSPLAPTTAPPLVPPTIPPPPQQPQCPLGKCGGNPVGSEAPEELTRSWEQIIETIDQWKQDQFTLGGVKPGQIAPNEYRLPSTAFTLPDYRDAGTPQQQFGKTLPSLGDTLTTQPQGKD